MSSCSRRSRLRSIVGELLRLIGDELADGFLDLAVERVHRRVGLDQLTAVAGVRGDLGFVLLQRLDGERARARAPGIQLLPHGYPLLGKRDELLARRDGGGQALLGGRLLGGLRFEAGDRRAQLREIGRQHALLPMTHRLADIRGNAIGCGSSASVRAAAIATWRRAASALAAFEVARLRFAVGGGFRRVELQEHVAGVHPAAVLDMDGDDRPASSGCTTFERPLGWILPGATA